MNHWYPAIATFGIGDFVTTVIGLSMTGIHEANPTANIFINEFGFAGILLSKVVYFLIVFGIAQTMPEKARKYGAYSVTTIGSLICLWNTFIIANAFF